MAIWDDEPVIAIVTVTGLDHKGIIAAVSGALARLDVNIVDVSQTIMGEFFTMILNCEWDDAVRSIEELQHELDVVGEQERVTIRLQSEAIFRAMHEI